VNNLKFALRQLLKNPGSTAVTVLALALEQRSGKETARQPALPWPATTNPQP
jgi:hypothetical protein